MTWTNASKNSASCTNELKTLALGDIILLQNGDGLLQQNGDYISLTYGGATPWSNLPKN